MGHPEGTEGDNGGFVEALGHPDVVRDAEAAQILFARVKGFPAWPAQVLSQELAEVHLGGVAHRATDAPVMFFGTAEIAWIGPRDLVQWGNGMAQKLHAKGRKHKKFVVALEQVRDYLSLTDERRAPDGWWCPPFSVGSQPSLGAPCAAESPETADGAASAAAVVGAAAADAEQAALLAAAAASLAAQQAALQQQAAAWEKELQQQRKQQAKKRAAPPPARPARGASAGDDSGGSSDSDFEADGANGRRRPRQRQRYSPDEVPHRRPRGDQRQPRRDSRRSGASAVGQLEEEDRDLPSPQQQQQQRPKAKVQVVQKHSSSGGGAGPLGSLRGSGGGLCFSDDGGDEEEALRRYIAAQAAEAATGAAGWACAYASDGRPVEPSGEEGVASEDEEGEEAFEYDEEAEFIAAAAAEAAKARRGAAAAPASAAGASAAWARAVAPPAAGAAAQRAPAAAAADGPLAPFDAVCFAEMAGLSGAVAATPAAGAAEEVTALPAPHRCALTSAVLRARRRGVRPVLGAATAVAAAFPGAFNGYVNAAVGRAGAVTAAAAALGDCFAAPPLPEWPQWVGDDDEDEMADSEDLEEEMMEEEEAMMALDGQEEWDGREEEGSRKLKKPRPQQQRKAPAKVRRVQLVEEDSPAEEEEEERLQSPAARKKAAVPRRKKAAAAAAAAAEAEAAPRPPPPPGVPAHLVADGPTVKMGDSNGPKFEMVRRNVYSGKDRPKRMARDEIAVCSCSVKTVTHPDGTVERTGCGDNCLNRVMKIHCDPKTCPCGDACANKPFHMLKSQAMEIFLTTNNRGHGVRAARPIARGEFVVEYAGEVIDSREMRRRMDAQRQLGQHHFYIMGLGPGMFIDAHKRGNLARLLNSSCEPNCETQKWYDAATGEMRVGIFAMRDIVPGEELTYDYMFEHEGGSALAQGFRCMCGAPKCRGTMDVNPERKRDYGRRLEVFWEGDRAWYAGTITGYFFTSGKHAVLYDDGDTERLTLSEVPHRWLDGKGAGVVQGPTARVPAGAEPPPIARRKGGKKAKAVKEEKEEEEEEEDGSSSGGEGGGGSRRVPEKGRRGSGAAVRRRDSGGGAAAARAPKRAAVVVSSPERRGKSGSADRRRQKQRRASAADANGGSSASTQTGLLPGPEEAAMQRLVAAAAAGIGAAPAAAAAAPQSPRTADREGVSGDDGAAKEEAPGAADGTSSGGVQHTTRGGLSALELLAAKEDAECAIASMLPPAARRRRGRRAVDGEGLLPVAQLLAGIKAVRSKGPELFCPSMQAQARSALTAAYGTGAFAAAAAAGGAYTAGKFRGLLERVAALEAAEGPMGDQRAAGDDCGDASDDGDEGDAAEMEAVGALRRLSGGGSLPQPLPPLFCAAPATAGSDAAAAAARRGSGGQREAAAALDTDASPADALAAAAEEGAEEGAAAGVLASGGAAEAADMDADATPEEAQRCESPAGAAAAASDGEGPEQEAPEPPPGPPRMDAGRQGPPVAA